MTERTRSVLLTLLLVVSSVSAGVGTVAATPTDSPTTFHVAQGDACYEVSPVTSSEDTVEEFYDYRAGEGTKYGSYGEGSKAIQDNQVSHLFVYKGEKGLSLVMLHDELNASKGGAISFDISGLPSDRKWVVEDDDYPNRDDNFDHGQTNSSIDWMWASGRTDGAAVRGLGGSFDAITIESAFGENSWAYQNRTVDGEHRPWPYATNDTDWKLRSGDGTEYDLTKGQSLTIEKGSCPDKTSPSAALSANPQTVETGESVSFDASASTDNQTAIAEYRWDFDGDGQIDKNTSSATTSHAYDAADTYDASVTVVDEGGNTDKATATVTVEGSSSKPVQNVTYINGTAVKVNGTYAAVDLTLGYYTESGYGQSRYVEENVSGTTVIHVEEDHGINGTIVNLVELHEDEFPGEAEYQKENPRLDYYAETIEPRPVTVSVDNVSEVENGTYEVTFAYDNPNEETLSMPNSTFSGNVSVQAPENFESGEHNFTATWTPETADDRATWTLNRSRFGQSDVSAQTPTAGELNGSEDTTAPTAVIEGPDTAYTDTHATFQADESTDNRGIVNYTWTFDGEDVKHGETVNYLFNETGEHNVTLTVEDAAGNTDTATKTIEAITQDRTKPVAKLSASPTVAEVNETVTFDASNSSDESGIAQYAWNFDGDESFERKTDSPTTTYNFSETGEHRVELMVVDNGTHGLSNVTSVNVTVQRANLGHGIKFVNESAVEVTGNFEKVNLRTTSFDGDGKQTSVRTFENVTGETVLTPDDEVWGPVTRSVAAYENASDDDPALSRANPDYAAQLEAVRPDKVSTFFESAKKVDNGTYEVTFGYENPNDRSVNASASAFTAGNVSGEPPTEFAPGRNTVTVTWTPASNDSNVVWRTDFSNFGYGASTTTGPTPDQIANGEMPPTAKLTADPTSVAVNETVTFDAAGSTDDGNVTAYKWDFDGDGEIDRTSQNATVGHVFRTAGTYHVTVTVVDESGQSDTATETVCVSEPYENEAPNAHLDVPSTVSADETVFLDARKSSDDHGIVWVKYYANGDLLWAGNPDSTPERTSLTPQKHLDGPGTYEFTVKVWDHGGLSDKASQTVEVTAADDGNDGGDGSDGNNGNNGDDGDSNKGIGDSPNNGNTGGGIGVVGPGGNGDSNDGNQNDGGNQNDDSKATAPLTDADGKVGSVVVRAGSSDADPTVKVSDTVPEGVTAPTVEADGFAALSYLNVSGAEQATFTVSKSRLADASATPDAVGLFRYDDGSWTAVETAQVNETEDAFRFRANVSDGTFAVGIGKAVTSVTDVSVQSGSVEPGETATVTATVRNTGHADGTQQVKLTVGGEVVATKNVSVAAGETTDVTFEHTLAESGVYEVSVGDQNAEIVVKGVETTTTDESSSVETTATPDNSSGVPGFGVGVALVALVAAALVALRRQ
ncbi:PKD domain-containing protein [Halorussus limi]|uniref:PKD domain-containing protein n=1 Tax=Halorussus limi TaxID=2938695 RepID=A0A8U0HS02_9EURY|nr:PKD domain-containing protein [Halorussus limi]UPV73845.1 PKD domain-containing protein [Halorussus limi]